MKPTQYRLLGCFTDAFTTTDIMGELLPSPHFLSQDQDLGLRRTPRVQASCAENPPTREQMRKAPVFVMAIAFICSGQGFAQLAEKEPAVVLELGGAASRSLTEHQSSFGPTLAVEVTPIENWLELEAGITPLFRRHSTEWSIDLLFKKPWELSEKREFMLGLGPEWIRTNANGLKTDSVAVEVAPDFMFWSSKKHRFGWYLEPSYEYKFGPGHEHSIAITGGLLIGIP